MKKEQQGHSSSNADSMYETDVSNATHNTTTAIDHNISGRSKRQLMAAAAAAAQQQPKRAKKSLENSWETSELPFAIETPVSAFGWCCMSAPFR